MTRSRNQIGPGGLLYLVVAVLILGAAVYTQANLLFWSFGLMVGGLVCSIAMSLVMLRRVAVTRLLPDHGVAGGELVIRYRLHNARRWTPAFNLVIRERWPGPRRLRRASVTGEHPPRLAGPPTGWVLHVGPQQTAQAEAVCTPLRRGPLRFGRIQLTSSFPFGILRRTIEFEEAAEVMVYPSLHRLVRTVLLQLEHVDVQGRLRSDRGGGTEEFFGLRSYRAGDSLRVIDWKHTARAGALLSREFTQSNPPRAMILLDLSQPDAPGKGGDDAAASSAERAISLAASLACDAYLLGYEIGLAVYGVEAPVIEPHHSLPHRARVLECLSTLDLGARVTRRPGLPAAPTVVIHPGDSMTLARGRACLRLGAADMARYLRDGAERGEAA